MAGKVLQLRTRIACPGTNHSEPIRVMGQVSLLHHEFLHHLVRYVRNV